MEVFNRFNRVIDFFTSIGTTTEVKKSKTNQNKNSSTSLNSHPAVSSGMALVEYNIGKNSGKYPFRQVEGLNKFYESIGTWNKHSESLKNNWRERVDDLNRNLNYLEDEEIINYINDVLNKKNFCYKDFEDIELLTDSVNMFNKLYCPYIGTGSSKYSGAKSSMTELAEFNKKINPEHSLGEVILGPKENLPECIKNSSSNIDFQADAAIENRIYGLKNYMKLHVGNGISEYLYNDYYLKLLEQKNVSPEIISELKDINDNYCVKVAIGMNVEDKIVHNALKTIKDELDEWVNASNGWATLPPVIDFSSAKSDWYDNTSAYGKSCSANYSEPAYNGALGCSKMDSPYFKRSLRHEITHTNDTKHGQNIDKKYDLDEIMPRKNINGREEIDIENCKYKDELLNAGIPYWRVVYAHNNTNEFIAIAAEGEMSKYSNELKQTLIDFGMPEWMFKMKSLPSYS